MKSAGKARNNGLYRHIRTSKEIIRNLLNDSFLILKPTCSFFPKFGLVAMLIRIIIIQITTKLFQ